MAIEDGVGEIARREAIACPVDAPDAALLPFIPPHAELPVELVSRPAGRAEQHGVADQRFGFGALASGQSTFGRLFGASRAIAVEVVDRDANAATGYLDILRPVQKVLLDLLLPE